MHSSDCIDYKNSPKPAGIHLSDKSMSFVIIKNHLVQIILLLTWRSFVRKGQRIIKVLDGNF